MNKLTKTLASLVLAAAPLIGGCASVQNGPPEVFSSRSDWKRYYDSIDETKTTQIEEDYIKSYNSGDKQQKEWYLKLSIDERAFDIITPSTNFSRRDLIFLYHFQQNNLLEHIYQCPSSHVRPESNIKIKEWR